MKKVLIIVENLPVPFDRRVWMEATTLRQAGYQVSVICPVGKQCEASYEEIDGIHIYRHEMPPERSSTFGYIREYAFALWHEWRLAKKIRTERGFDLIQACNPPDLIFLIAGWLKLTCGTRFIFDHHDLCPELYESKFHRRGFFYHVLRFTERLTFSLADIVISTNDSYREIAIARGKKCPETVHVVRSAPNLALFCRTPENPVFRRDRRYLVGYVGVMGEFDGVEHLVKTAHELIVNRGRTDIQFCLIGTGPMLRSLKTLADNLGIREFVEFTGRIPDAELIERLSTCDVCVNPDPLNPLNDKSTMNKILEYMALAKPIVQYDLLEGRRSAGEASLYAEPNNIQEFATHIETLLSDPDARIRMGQIGWRRMAASLEWRHQAPALLRAYANVFSSIVSSPGQPVALQDP